MPEGVRGRWWTRPVYGLLKGWVYTSLIRCGPLPWYFFPFFSLINSCSFLTVPSSVGVQWSERVASRVNFSLTHHRRAPRDCIERATSGAESHLKYICLELESTRKWLGPGSSPMTLLPLPPIAAVEVGNPSCPDVELASLESRIQSSSRHQARYTIKKFSSIVGSV